MKKNYKNTNDYKIKNALKEDNLKLASDMAIKLNMTAKELGNLYEEIMKEGK